MHAADRWVAETAGVSNSHAEILHDARVWDHVGHLDLVGQDTGVVEEAVETTVRLETWSLGRRASSHKATTATTSALRGDHTSRISCISVPSHGTLRSNYGQHGVDQSPSFASSCSETSHESCELWKIIYFKLFLTDLLPFVTIRYDLKFAKAALAPYLKTVHWWMLELSRSSCQLPKWPHLLIPEAQRWVITVPYNRVKGRWCWPKILMSPTTNAQRYRTNKTHFTSTKSQNTFKKWSIFIAQHALFSW